IPVSFTEIASFSFPPQGFSLKWYEVLLDKEEWLSVTKNSFIIAISTALLATFLGVMAAVAADSINFPGKGLFINLTIAPMAIPGILVAIALFFKFSDFNLTNTYTGVILGHTILAVPFVFTSVYASLRGLDKNLPLAAEGLGSTP